MNSGLENPIVISSPDLLETNYILNELRLRLSIWVKMINYGTVENFKLTLGAIVQLTTSNRGPGDRAPWDDPRRQCSLKLTYLVRE